MTDPEKKTILVVDDEEDIRTFLGTLLEDSGFRVLTAANGNEAIAHFNEQTPDLVSLDLVMPGKSGIKFLFELRRNKAWSKVPVLIVTGHARDELGGGDFREIMAGKVLSGPRSYLEKPVDPRTYVNTVRRQLNLPIEQGSNGEPARSRSEMKRALVELIDSADDRTLRKLLDVMGGK